MKKYDEIGEIYWFAKEAILCPENGRLIACAEVGFRLKINPSNDIFECGIGAFCS